MKKHGQWGWEEEGKMERTVELQREVADGCAVI